MTPSLPGGGSTGTQIPQQRVPTVAGRQLAYQDPVQPWAEPRSWRQHGSDSPKPAANPPEQPANLDPMQPWAEPRTWRQQIKPTERHPANLAQPAMYQDFVQPPAEPRHWRQPIAQDEKPAASRHNNVSDVNATSPALDGFCPVELVENEQWTPGNRLWVAVHRGRVYVFSGPDQQQRFMANPDRYAPVLSGNDPVWAVDGNRSVRGATEFCVVYDGRLYMFSSASGLARFRQNPKRYAGIAQQTAY